MPLMNAAVNPVLGKVGFDKRYLERAITLSQVELNQVHDRCAYEVEGQAAPVGYLMIYMLSGNGVVAIGKERLPVPHRHLMWIQPKSRYQIQAADQTYEVLRLVSVEVKPKAGRQQLSALFHPEGCNRVIRDSEGIDDLLFDLMKELQVKDDYSQIMLDGLLNRILVHSDRLIKGEGRSPNGNVNLLNKKELVYQAVQYIDLHVEGIEELGQVAKALGYSYSHLSHAFRAEMGVPMQVYWAQRRMLRAMNRLQSGRSSITQISEDLQYQSIHSFSKAFKKVTGFTPSEYQSLYGKG